MKRSTVFTTLTLAILVVASFVYAGPFRHRVAMEGCPNGQCGTQTDIEARPTILSYTVEPTELATAGTVTITWSTNGGRSVSLNSETVAASGTQTYNVTETTDFTLTVKGRLRADSKTVTVTVGKPPEPTPGPTPPEPTPPPTTDSTLCVVAFGDAFDLSDKLSTKARSKDVLEYLKSCNGRWLEISEALLKEKHNKALDEWWEQFKLTKLSPPAIATYQVKNGKVTKPVFDAVDENTDLVALLKSRTVQPNAGRIFVGGKERGLGFIKTPTNLRRKVKGQEVQAVRVILTPKTVADIPKEGIDLRHLMPFLLDQGPYGTCVSQAVTSAASSAAFVQFGKDNFILFSPNFLATRINGWNGAWAEQAIEEAISSGLVSLADQPNYSSNLPSGWKTKAGAHKVIGVYASPQKNARGTIIAALLRGYPVVVAIGVGGGFNPDSNGRIGYRRGGTSSVNHQVIFCGARVNSSNQIEWLMKNSWGDWGIYGDGTAWLVEDGSGSWVGDDVDLDIWIIVRMSAGGDYHFDSPTPTVAP